MRKRQMIRKRMHDTENKNKKSTYEKTEERIILNDLPKKHVHGMHGSTLVYINRQITVRGLGAFGAFGAFGRLGRFPGPHFPRVFSGFLGLPGFPGLPGLPG